MQTTSWLTPDLAPGRAYYFAVQAVNLDGLTSPLSEEVTVTTAGAARPTVGDFRGTGRADLSVFRSGRGEWYVYGATPIAFGIAGDVPVAGDYDGDGRSDIAVWRPNNGVWYILGSASEYRLDSMIQVEWGTGRSGDIPVPGDYDGDGRTDIAVWRPSAGVWFILRSTENYSHSTYLAVQWGLGAQRDVPVPGDYDGDGRTDIAVWRARDGVWYLLRSSTNYDRSAYQTVQWGVGSERDVPVPGDYDGDGRADIAVWRPRSGMWFLLRSSQNYDRSQPAMIQWGQGSERDIPVPLDYDGDGRTDIAVWRPSSGNWYALKSTESFNRSSFMAQQWGVESLRDIPAAAGIPLAALNPRLAGY